MYSNLVVFSLCPQPIRISVHYWRVCTDKTESRDLQKLPCILDSREASSTGPGGEAGRFHVYGLPTDEYPGMVKVSSMCMAYQLTNTQGW